MFTIDYRTNLGYSKQVFTNPAVYLYSVLWFA